MENNKRAEYLNEKSLKYKIIKSEDSINSTVDEVHYSDPNKLRINPYFAYIELSNKDNYEFIAVPIYHNKDFAKQIKVGDRIIKNQKTLEFRLINNQGLDTLVYILDYSE